MNIREYRKFISKKAEEEITRESRSGCAIRHQGNRFRFAYYNSYGNEIASLKPSILDWLEKNKNIFDNVTINSGHIYADLINTEKYEKETLKEQSTKYDEEIEQLEERLTELKTLQKAERENKKKRTKIEQLEQQIKELKGENK